MCVSFHVMDPLVGLSKFKIIRKVVVLPAPFPPKNPYISPSSTCSDMSSTAVCSLNTIVRLLIDSPMQFTPLSCFQFTIIYDIVFRYIDWRKTLKTLLEAFKPIIPIFIIAVMIFLFVLLYIIYKIGYKLNIFKRILDFSTYFGLS